MNRLARDFGKEFISSKAEKEFSDKTTAQSWMNSQKEILKETVRIAFYELINCDSLREYFDNLIDSFFELSVLSNKKVIVRSNYDIFHASDESHEVILSSFYAARSVFLFFIYMPLARRGSLDQSRDYSIILGPDFFGDPLVGDGLVKLNILNTSNLLQSGSAHEQIKVFIDGAKEKVSALSSRLEVDIGKLDDYKSEAQDSLDDFIMKAKKDLESVKATVLEFGKLDSAEKIWMSKKKVRYVVAIIGYILLLSLALFVLYLSFYYWGAIRSEVIDRLSTKDGYYALPFILVPVIFVGWVLRLIARVLSNSFILADDAAQRQALLQTYYRLVSDKNAEMEPRDRLLVLNALFRPIPGQQVDEINPPTFADIAGDIFKTKGS